MSNTHEMRCSAVVAAVIMLGAVAMATSAADLYVAGTIGEVYVGDSESGGFEVLGGACLAPIQALAMSDAFIYAGDLNGGVLTIDLATGDFANLYFMKSGITAMAMYDDELLISDGSTIIHRIDPATGAVDSTIESPWGVEAMLVVGDDLYVNGIEGSVWRGSITTGVFEYFGCACSGNIQGIVHDDTSVYVVDNFGQFNRFEIDTGWLTWEGSLPFGDVSAMVMDDDVLLISESDGTIHRMDPLDVVELGSLTSPIVVQAMLLGIPAPACVADIDGSGDVGVTDLLNLLAAWGTSPGGPPDFDGDGVGITDLLTLLESWGSCP